MSVNAGPLKHEWYEDFGHGSDRRVKYWDDDETVEFAYTAFAYDWKNRIRHPEEEYEETEDQKPGFVRRAFARITRPFRRTI